MVIVMVTVMVALCFAPVLGIVVVSDAQQT